MVQKQSPKPEDQLILARIHRKDVLYVAAPDRLLRNMTIVQDIVGANNSGPGRGLFSPIGAFLQEDRKNDPLVKFLAPLNREQHG
jgi:hypothetical protein